ncbi:MAG: dTDP-4-dehydrorhamnose reductase [Treponema sp.]|jgi:dTDP-4-dehydrorhamnose reductase|nr:dTDP-4-dehydrorhamnose reductase [Treponema sp.]
MPEGFAGKVVWLIGNKGMLGTELSLLLEERKIPFTGTDRDVDITDEAALTGFARQKPVNWIVNCAAYTAVDKAEDDGETCRALNTLGAANIARCAKSTGARLIQLSTDYVFDGKGNAAGDAAPRPCREDDETNPIGVYGLTKRDGEQMVLENNPASYIIRTAWLYGAYGNNFVRTMLRLMGERDEVNVVNDQRGSPTWARDLAGLILTLIETADKPGAVVPCGIYHYTNEGNISWFDFALEIYRQGRSRGLLVKDCKVKPCTSTEFPARVKRPEYSVLDKTKIKTTLGITIPAWDKSLGSFLGILTKDKGSQWKI